MHIIILRLKDFLLSRNILTIIFKNVYVCVYIIILYELLILSKLEKLQHSGYPTNIKLRLSLSPTYQHATCIDT